MTKKIAINGFGRIGRCVFRAFFENQAKYKDLEIVAINDLAPLETNLYLLKYDSVHGKFNHDAKIEDGSIVVDGKKIRVCSERDAHNLPWKELGVDIVLECTGLFLEREKAMPHIEAGAKKVMMSGPTKTPDTVKTIVYGVNDSELNENDDIISNLDIIGKKRGCLIKGGEVDYDKVYVVVLNDIKDGYIKNITFDRYEL